MGMKWGAGKMQQPCGIFSTWLIARGWSRDFLSEKFSIWFVWEADVFRFCIFPPFPEEFGVTLNNCGSFKAGGLAETLSSRMVDIFVVTSATSSLLLSWIFPQDKKRRKKNQFYTLISQGWTYQSRYKAFCDIYHSIQRITNVLPLLWAWRGEVDWPRCLVMEGRVEDILWTFSVHSDIDFCIAGATSLSWLLSTCTWEVLESEEFQQGIL